MENEIWKDIVGFKFCYQISNRGRVKKVNKDGTNRPISYKMQGNRQTVRLRKVGESGEYKHEIVANLVANAFLPKTYEWQDYVEHIDGNNCNNRVENLRWSTTTNKEVKIAYSKIANLKGHNQYYVENDVVHVFMHNTGNVMMCEKAIWEKWKKYTWNEHFGYAKANIQKKEIAFHRLVKQPPEGYVIDHINRNRLDNRACNLRVTTQYVNTINRDASPTSSTKLKGVYKDKNRYRADITVKGERIYLGMFPTAEEAANARRQAEEKYYKPIIEKETLHMGCFF